METTINELADPGINSLTIYNIFLGIFGRLRAILGSFSRAIVQLYTISETDIMVSKMFNGYKLAFNSRLFVMFIHWWVYFSLK